MISAARTLLIWQSGCFDVISNADIPSCQTFEGNKMKVISAGVVYTRFERYEPKFF